MGRLLHQQGSLQVLVPFRYMVAHGVPAIAYSPHPNRRIRLASDTAAYIHRYIAGCRACTQSTSTHLHSFRLTLVSLCLALPNACVRACSGSPRKMTASPGCVGAAAYTGGGGGGSAACARGASGADILVQRGRTWLVLAAV